MQPYLLKIPLQRKDPEVHFEACQVDHVHTLSESEFRFFQHNLMLEHDFLRDYNLHHAAPPSEGVRNGVLILSSGSDDGILVCTEGYDYARYSAYVPYAKQILMLKQYPALQDYGKEMADLVDKCIQKAVTVGLPEPYKLSLEALGGESAHQSFNDELFLEMLGNRSEVEDMEVDGDDLLLTISQEHLPRRDQELRVLLDEDLKVACAKHLLWLYDAGGEQANFSNCEFLGVDFSGMELNSAVFDGAVFKSCTFHDASLCFTSMKGCTFIGCGCRDMTAEEAVFRNAVFDHCDLTGAVMTHSDLSGAVLQDSETENASLQNCLIKGMLLRDAGSATLNMVGTTIDEEAWSGQELQALSEEELL
jgi:hypothetical protein